MIMAYVDAAVTMPVSVDRETIGDVVPLLTGVMLEAARTAESSGVGVPGIKIDW
jgi:hypothetical protein